MSDDEKTTTYKMKYVRLNCLTSVIEKIPFGYPAPTKPKLEKCPYCGCTHFSHPKKP